MENILQSIETSLDQGNLYVAIMAALCLPDICSSLSNPGIGVGKRYEAWFEEFMPDYKGWMTGEEAYGLRCVILHNGDTSLHHFTSNGKKSTLLDKFELNNNIHRMRMTSNTRDGKPTPNLVAISPKEYCKDLITAVRLWATVNGDLANSETIFEISNETTFSL